MSKQAEIPGVHGAFLFIDRASGRARGGSASLGRRAEAGVLGLQVELLEARLRPQGKLRGKRIVVTAGPTREPIDPVRFIGNRSSGKQGHAIAAALAALGCDTRLIAGPTRLPDPPGVPGPPLRSPFDSTVATVS